MNNNDDRTYWQCNACNHGRLFGGCIISTRPGNAAARPQESAREIKPCRE